MIIFVEYRIHVYDMEYLMLLNPLFILNSLLVSMSHLSIDYLNHLLRYSSSDVNKIILLSKGYLIIISSVFHSYCLLLHINHFFDMIQQPIYEDMHFYDNIIFILMLLILYRFIGNIIIYLLSWISLIFL